MAEAQQRLLRAVALGRRAGAERVVAVAQLYAGLAAIEAGDVDDGRALVQAARVDFERADNPLHQEIAAAFLAVACAAAGRIDDAAVELAAAAALSRRGAPWSAVLLLCAALVHLARARDATLRGDVVDAARERGLAESNRGEAQAASSSSDDVRILTRHVDRAAALLAAAAPERPAARRARRVLLVGPSCAWFAFDGHDRVDLSRRRLLRVLFAALVERRGQPLTFAALVQLGWPGEERLPAEVHKNRLHVALSSLRSLGLRDVLLHDDAGYRLADDVDVDVLG